MKEALKMLSQRLAGTAEFARPLSAGMRGLHIMTDDPANVGVVFTTDRAHSLQNRMNSVCQLIYDELKNRNLVSQQSLMSQRVLSSDGIHAEVKLHATLMNTKYSRSNWREDGSRGDRESFDAGVLMERFGQVEFGDVPLREIQLSCLEEMGTICVICGKECGTLEELKRHREADHPDEEPVQAPVAWWTRPSCRRRPWTARQRAAMLQRTGTAVIRIIRVAT